MDNNIKKTKPSDLWRKEDWLACWIGFIVIAIATIAVLTKTFDFSAIKFATWTFGENLSETAASKFVPLGQQITSWTFWSKALTTILVLGSLFAIGVKN